MKTIRTWVYAILKYKDSIVVIKKWRWPFTWCYDLPWGKIEHWEENYISLQREIEEEIGLNKNDFNIERILTAEEDFVQHIWKWEKKDEHLIAIVYLANIIVDDFDFSYIEKWWDADWMILMKLDDSALPKTNILKKALKRLNNS